MSLDAVCDTHANPREQTMTTHGYARVSRGRDDGTDTLQNKRVRLTGAGVDAGHIHQDIITGTVMQRPCLNALLNVIRAPLSKRYRAGAAGTERTATL